jgi:hypothetical protein
VEVGPAGDGGQRGQRVTGDPDVPDLAGLPQGGQGGQGLPHHLVEIAELDVVHLDQVEVTGAEAGQALVDAAAHPGGAEVEVVDAVPAHLGGQGVGVAIDAGQGPAEDGLGPGPPVVRRDVEDGDPEVQRGPYRADAGGQVDPAVDVAERGGAVTEHRDAQLRAGDLPLFHRAAVRSLSRRPGHTHRSTSKDARTGGPLS